MAEPNSPKIPAQDLDPDIRARQEALTDSLRSGGHPDPPRAFSTLFDRPESVPDGAGGCAYCESLIRSVVRHLTGHVVVEQYPASYHALLAAVDSFDGLE